MAIKASVRDVRRTNRALVVRHLLLAGETSRSEVGSATGLSPATVTSVIAELIAEGTVREGGLQDSEGGRRRILLGLNPDAARVFGTDVSETEITTSLFTLTLERLASRSTAFQHRRVAPDRVAGVIEDHVRELLTETGAERSRVIGLGLGVPGVVENPATPAAVVHADVIGWSDVVFSGLEERLGFAVLVDNGAKTTTQAESWYGSAHDVDHAIVVLIGDGAGAGIITNGRLYRGSSSSAGEWGHTKISVDGTACRCGSYGCVETFVGASAVLERWQGNESFHHGGSEGIETLLLMRELGDMDATAAVHNLIEHLGLALSNLVNLYNPQKIIVGGWFGDIVVRRFTNELRAAVRRFSLASPGDEVVVEPSTLGVNALALGAATLPIDRFIETGLIRHTPNALQDAER